MLRTIDLRGSSDLDAALPRADFSIDSALPVVAAICDDVKARGAAAITELSTKFDHVTPASLRVPIEVIDAAVAGLEPKLRDAIELAITRRRQVCEQTELAPVCRSIMVAPGARVDTREVPMARVGLYVPGGLAPLASSVVHNAVPAQVAGVEAIAIASPPQPEFDGWPHPTILAVCGLLGVDEVYAVGGAQAIAMFAYGVPGVCQPVDLVTGPGNIYVAAAKRHLQGVVGIDSEAGPTEIAILGDKTALPYYAAADLVSQAEHDPLAAAVLITDDIYLAERVENEVMKMVKAHVERERLETSLSGPQSAIVLVRDMEQGLEVANAYGAEHLEVMTADAAELASRVRNAGAIFIGPYSPVSLGDYSAGSTHVLPTGGTARFASGLTVRAFTKQVHVISYDAAALDEVADDVVAFALAEHLPGHAQAVSVRQGR